MTENEEWLALAESAFADWDNPQDAMYDDIEFWIDLGREHARHERRVLRLIVEHLGLTKGATDE